MTRRMGEITLAEIKRKWRHHVALPSEKGRARYPGGLDHAA
jgi:hypothetical protein